MCPRQRQLIQTSCSLSRVLFYSFFLYISLFSFISPRLCYRTRIIFLYLFPLLPPGLCYRSSPQAEERTRKRENEKKIRSGKERRGKTLDGNKVILFFPSPLSSTLWPTHPFKTQFSSPFVVATIRAYLFRSLFGSVTVHSHCSVLIHYVHCSHCCLSWNCHRWDRVPVSWVLSAMST